MNAPRVEPSIPSEENLNLFLSELYERYRALMYSVAHRYVRDSEMASDVVSDCWLSLIKNAASLMELDEANALNYIALSTRNTAINSLKRERRWRNFHVRMEQYEEEAFVDPFDVAHVAEANIELERTLQTVCALPERLRRIVVLKYVWGFRDAEIAYHLGLSTSSVRKYVGRARERLQNALQL